MTRKCDEEVSLASQYGRLETGQDRMERELTACPVCSGNHLKTYVEPPQEATLNLSSLGSSRKTTSHGRILRCDDCGFAFLAKRLSDEELAKLYADLDDTVYEGEAEGRRRTALRHVRIVRRYVRSGRLLDVGCASGGFLAACMELGFEVVGVEPAEKLFRKAEKLLGCRGEVYGTVLQKAPLVEKSFDAITLWDVLEHVYDPVAFMELCASLLKPGGLLFVNVPDIDSLQARVLGSRWPLYLPEHLNYFNRKSLRECGNRAGIRLQKFGRRPAYFSVDYLFYRTSQHNIPGAPLVRRVAKILSLERRLVPVFLGETYAVWQR